MKRGLGIVILLLVLPGAAQAQVMIDPISVQLTLPGGKTGSTQLTLYNHTDRSVELSVEPEYWRPTVLSQPLNEWLRFSSYHMTLGPEERRALQVDLKVPEQLAGECLVMVFFAQKPFGQSFQIQSRVGIPIYVRVQGKERMAADLTTFQPLAPTVEGNPAFRLEVRNRGNVHLVPFGVIVLRGPAGAERTSQQVFKFQEPIFAGETRSLEVSFPGSRPPAGDYRAEAKVFLDNLYREDPGGKFKVKHRECRLSFAGPAAAPEGASR